MIEDMKVLHKNHTWELVKLPSEKKTMECKWVKLPSEKKTIECKWVFTVKHNATAFIERNKAIIVGERVYTDM